MGSENFIHILYSRIERSFNILIKHILLGRVIHRFNPQNGICTINRYNSIFGLQIMVKSGLEKMFLKFLHAGDYFPLLHKSAQNHKFSNKNNYLPAWRDFKINFSRPLFTIIFRPKMVFLDTDYILMVKTIFSKFLHVGSWSFLLLNL